MKAGAARVSLEPPLGLPMIGFVRMWQTAAGYGLPLEATALVLESGETRVALIGVDTLGIQAPEVDRLRERVADAVGTEPSHVLLNWNHTHLAPPGGRSFVRGLAQVDDAELTGRLEAYVDELHDKVVSVAAAALASLEPARVVWTVTTGPDIPIYSADFPGALRAAVREWTGGECVFFQGAAGNVLPLVCFTESEKEAVRLGRALALEALHAVAKGQAWPVSVERESWGSVTPISLYRRRAAEGAEQALAVAEERAIFPLQPVPTLEEIQRMRAEFDAKVEAAQDEGPERLRTVAYHARWAEQTEEKIRAGEAPTELDGPITAVRIGDGVIATGPGEIFGEIGLAVKERSPAEVTLYAGYTNGIVTYFPTAAEFPLGGYEPDYGNRSFGQVAQVTPESERILTETAVRLVEGLF